MKIVVQRVKQASVMVENEIISSINKGYLLLVGIEHTDTFEDIKTLANKVSKLRIFEDEDGKMNLNIKDVDGEILSVSQFTLAAETHRGNRPSFSNAKSPQEAKLLFNQFNDLLREKEISVLTGQFQSMMEVSLINDGPVTILLKSKGS